MITHKWISSLAVATVVSLTSFASAAADDDAAGSTVKAWDLDLAKPDDLQTFYARVQDAAIEVCRAEARRHWRKTRDRAPVGWHERCVQGAVDTALRDVADPHLAALARPGVARNE